MADDSGGFSQFLTDTESIESVEFSLASGVQWGRLAGGIVGGTIASIVLGIQSLISAGVELMTRLLDGFSDFSGAVIETLGTTSEQAIAAAWTTTFGQFGVFALPVVIAVFVVTVYIAGRVTDRLPGGDVL